MATKKLSILGSTGSIGTQALSLVDPLGIRIISLSGNKNAALLEEQALKYNPENVCAVDETTAKDLKIKLAHTDIKVLCGEDGLLEIAGGDESDTVLTSVVGIAGLRPTVAAIEAKKDIALANKETLVAGGKLITELVKKQGVKMLPVDSEHSAIFQCLQDVYSAKTLSKIFLTASGGPFFGRTREQLKDVGVKEALNHPNWTMGKKVTIDSASLMNKGLELIEAMWLFSLSPDEIEITVHRQSIVHSMVEFIDGSVIAQLGVPDMRTPIQYALTYPDRAKNEVNRLTIERMSSLTFERADEGTFECLAACKKAAKMGSLAPCYANGANEVAVEAFLDGKIGFLDIGRAVTNAVNKAKTVEQYSIDELLDADKAARELTREYLFK